MNYFIASPVTLKSAIFLCMDGLIVVLTIIMALKGIAFSSFLFFSFLAYLIIYLLIKGDCGHEKIPETEVTGDACDEITANTYI